MTANPGIKTKYLFSLPDGFREIKYQESQRPDLETGTAHTCKIHPINYSPVSLMFTRTANPNQSPLNDKQDLDCFPEPLTVLTLEAKINPDPLTYLVVMDEQLQNNLPQYHNDFCRAENKEKHSRFISQSRFQTNFIIFRLSYCWIYKNNLIIITLNVADGKCEHGWQILRKFAHSFKLL